MIPRLTIRYFQTFSEPDMEKQENVEPLLIAISNSWMWISGLASTSASELSFAQVFSEPDMEKQDNVEPLLIAILNSWMWISGLASSSASELSSAGYMCMWGDHVTLHSNKKRHISPYRKCTGKTQQRSPTSLLYGECLYIMYFGEQKYIFVFI